jgi:monofunctional biosynthetic peptidoglycan transglycosylase
LIPLDGFVEGVRQFRAEGGHGCNVTVPFKFESPALATRLTPRASLAQASNVLRFDDHEVFGDNTDGIGLVQDILQNAGVALQGRDVLLVGAGACRTAHGTAHGVGRLARMKALGRWLLLFVLAGVALEMFFIARIALAATVDPQSTAFERSEAWRIATHKGKLRWRQEWVPYERISDNLKRAVIASEDGTFANHDGVDWEAIEKAWQRNAQAEERAAKLQEKLDKQHARQPRRPEPAPVAGRPIKIVGGSTITQQLAKNLLLSGERTLLRKGQEIVLTFALEKMLSKERILEIYLNSVEWGEGVFGAEAAARHYYRKGAGQLTAYESARLAVMLPRPKYFEKLPNSGYLSSRASTIVARMRAAELP